MKAKAPLFVSMLALGLTVIPNISMAVGATKNPGAMCTGSEQKNLFYSVAGTAINPFFNDATFICPVPQKDEALPAALIFHVSVRDMPGKAITCLLRNHSPDAITGKILATVTSNGSHTAQNLSVVTSAAPIDPNGFLLVNCTVPLSGQVISYGVSP